MSSEEKGPKQASASGTRSGDTAKERATSTATRASGADGTARTKVKKQSTGTTTKGGIDLRDDSSTDPPQRSVGAQRRRQAEDDRKPNKERATPKGVILLVLIVIGAILLTGWQVVSRLNARDHVQFEGVVLAVEDIGLSVETGGRVTELNVDEQDAVSEGDIIAIVESTGTDGETVIREIVAPQDGLVLHVFAETGERVGINEAVVTMYDPADMHFRLGASYGQLTQVRIGTEAELDFTDIDRIDAVFTRVEAEDPRAAAANEPGAVMILEPTAASRALVEELIPGLVLSADLDKTTAPDGAPTGLRSAGLG